MGLYILILMERACEWGGWIGTQFCFMLWHCIEGNWEKRIYSFIASSLWKGLALLPLEAIIFSYIPSFIQQLNGARVGSESSKRERLIDLLTPYILCVIANLLLWIDHSHQGLYRERCSRYVLLSYGQAFGALTTGVLALLYERFPSTFSLFLMALSYYSWH